MDFIIEVLRKDHDNFLESLVLKYGSLADFTKSDLVEQFPFEKVDVVLEKEKKTYKKRNSNQKCKIEKKYDNNRCQARCWGGNPKNITYNKSTKIWSMGNLVSYNENNQEWTYGTQCTNVVLEKDTQYCGTHLNQINSKWGYLSQGRIDEEPPHPHYGKYKKKLAIQICANK
jgi:hypothetical protein